MYHYPNTRPTVFFQFHYSNHDIRSLLYPCSSYYVLHILCTILTWLTQATPVCRVNSAGDLKTEEHDPINTNLAQNCKTKNQQVNLRCKCIQHFAARYTIQVNYRNRNHISCFLIKLSDAMWPP